MYGKAHDWFKCHAIFVSHTIEFSANIKASRITQGAYEVTSCAFKVNEPVGPAALKTTPKVNIKKW